MAKVVKSLTFAAHFAGVTKLADVPDLGSGGGIHVGSSPITRTNFILNSSTKVKELYRAKF